MTDDALPVAELAEYCRTQAGLLAGQAETIRADTDELLDEIDADIATIRERLAAHSSGPESATATPPTAGGDTDGDLTDLEELESELEEKQAVAEAKQARMVAFQDLSEAYAELAMDLEESVDEEDDALRRVVKFEREHDAPAYFDDRLTVLEAVAEAND